MKIHAPHCTPLYLSEASGSLANRKAAGHPRRPVCLVLSAAKHLRHPRQSSPRGSGERVDGVEVAARCTWRGSGQAFPSPGRMGGVCGRSGRRSASVVLSLTFVRSGNGRVADDRTRTGQAALLRIVHFPCYLSTRLVWVDQRSQAFPLSFPIGSNAIDGR